MRMKTSEWLGWYGVVAILVAYLLNNFGLLSVKDVSYQLLNLTGALGIAVDALKQKNYQPVVLNIIWGLVALLAILKTLTNL